MEAQALLTPVVRSFSCPVACLLPARVGGERGAWGALVAAANDSDVTGGLSLLRPKVVYVSPFSGKTGVHRYLNSIQHALSRSGDSCGRARARARGGGGGSVLMPCMAAVVRITIDPVVAWPQTYPHIAIRNAGKEHKRRIFHRPDRH